jgi:hypothetical protein
MKTISGISARPKTLVQPKASRQAGGEQRGQRGARVAGAGDAHRRALVLGGIPARGQRQRGGEGGAGNAEEEAEDQRLLVAVDAMLPGDEQRDDDDDLADGAGHLRLQVVDQHAHHQAQQRAGQHRCRDHEALLRMGQVEVGGDLHAERAEDHPDHEGEIEVEKGGEQRRRVAGLEKGAVEHGHDVLPRDRNAGDNAMPVPHQRKPRQSRPQQDFGEVGNGMAGVRTLEELLKLAPDLYDITVFGAEPHPNYNRILLSPVLAGEMSCRTSCSTTRLVCATTASRCTPARS